MADYLWVSPRALLDTVERTSFVPPTNRTSAFRSVAIPEELTWLHYQWANKRDVQGSLTYRLVQYAAMGGTPLWRMQPKDFVSLGSARTMMRNNGLKLLSCLIQRRPCLSSGGQLLSSHHCGPGTRRAQVMWDLWWTQQYWGRLPPSTSVALLNRSSDCAKLIIIHLHPGLVQ
jgi:hypothetical protein